MRYGDPVAEGRERGGDGVGIAGLELERPAWAKLRGASIAACGSMP